MTTTTEFAQSSELSECRFRITVAYDGRLFHGWQSQPSGQTVQDELLAALRSIHPAITTVQASGRTDTGVSARGQVAHFDVPADWKMNAGAWERALNSKLPRTVRVMGSRAVDSDFHARYSAVGKEYRYRIYSGRTLPPLDFGLAWHVVGDLDRLRLREALLAFVGEHDFGSFSANRGDGSDVGTDKRRLVTTADLLENGEHELELVFRGSGFLYKMVRFLAGSVVRVGQERWTLGELQELLGGGAEQKAPHCAPADGLILEEVYYPE